MSHHTQSFEELLAVRNVVAVNYDPDRDCVDVWVAQKLAPHDLAPDDLVTNNLPDDYDGDHDVHDAGMDDEREGFDPAIAANLLDPNSRIDPATASARKQRHRPVEAAVSECNASSTAATSGVLARLDDAEQGEWGDHVAPGDLVRISNHHVYGRPLNATALDGSAAVLQPSPYDGGGEDDAVGSVAAYAVLEDGCTVDAAARTIDYGAETRAVYDPPVEPAGVRREDYADLRDETVTKGGRTTGTTEATLTAHDASVNVGYGGDIGVVTLRHQLLAGDMSAGGDSGSPVFHAASGDLVGHLFAGSGNVTVINRAAEIERSLGVELMPDETESLTAEVQVEMDSPTLSHLETAVMTQPGSGEHAGLRVTVTSDYPGTAWLEAVGPAGSSRVEAAIPEKEVAFDIDIEVPAPAEYTPEFTVRLTGGHVLD